MNKLFQLIEENAVKIVVTTIITWGLFFGILYVQSIKQDIAKLKELTAISAMHQVTVSMVTLQGLEVILQSLDDLSKQQQFVIDQQSAKDSKSKEVVTKTKPTYEELKSHSVLIYGCTSQEAVDKKLTYNIDDNGGCWSGTGVVVKVTDTETYILTNNHVAGKTEPNVILFVENDTEKVRAEVVKYNNYVDAAVIKVKGTFKDKNPITKMGTVNIQDPVYIVGNPLHNKMVYTEGVMAGYTGISILIQAPCIYGNSGSGVFNAKGELVGLVYALQVYPGWIGIIPEAQITHSVIVDTASIYIFLKDLGLYND